MDLQSAQHGTLRRLVGYGARGMMLARTSIGRAVCYRSAEDVGRRGGQAAGSGGPRPSAWAGCPAAPARMLTHGGDPLTIPERARLILARALFATPALLVFDHLDADLGREGRATMRELLRDYPGVVVIASDDPWAVVTPTCVWKPLPRQPLDDADVATAVPRRSVTATGGLVLGTRATDRQSETVP